MELSALPISRFVDLLASDAPAPGGGAAAALGGALGASLTAMVCSLTVGREKYAQHEALAARSLERARELSCRFLAAMEEDAGAYGAVSQAFKLPRGTEEERAHRSAVIQQGLEACIRPPLAMMELAVETLELTEALIGRSNVSAVSDLGVSALCLRAAVQGGWLNVRINLASLNDRELTQAFQEKGEALLAKALPLADEIYEKTAALL